MKCCIRLLCCLAVFALAFGGLVAGDDEVTLKGSFVWSRDDGDRTGDLQAVFTPTGDDEWTVAFHFDWEDEAHVYQGKAAGSLSNGKLKGEADSDDDNHKLEFRFSGSFENGMFSGTHGYLTKDGSLKTGGTLKLQPAG